MASTNGLTGRAQSLHAQPRTVLYLHSSDDLYGADLILLQIVTGLDKTRYRPVVVLPDDMKHIGLLSRELEAAGIEYHHLPIAVLRRRYLTASGILLFFWRIMLGTWTACRLARQWRVELVHGFTLAVIAAPAVAFALRLPLIMHAHEILLKPRSLRKGIHFLVTRSARLVLCVSGPVRANILEDEPWAVNKVRVLHNGIALPPAPTESREQLRQQLGVATNLPLVGMIGRISPWKGQEIFAQAISLLRAKGIPARFVSIGGVFDDEIHHLERLQHIVAALSIGDVLTLVGYQKNARRFVSAFDVLVLPSTSPDPLPTVVLEAMSAGIPVIATAHGGALEMVVDQETGLLVFPSDPNALAEAIQLLLDDPERARRLGHASRVRFGEHFSLDRFLCNIHDLYANAIRSNPIPRALT